ncbi:hypothetical protein HGRIS_008124 [Hohenbuehelia grisea]|uniref:Mid2 domain-containing protein n=1 Tax=Hohenbuehelia grisea TaxID=104357 RepID=A0ABR3J7F0_9AGAR
MFITKPQKLTLTLVFYLTLALTLAGSSEAKSFAGSSLHNREHANLKRMFKKRAPLPQTAAGNGRTPPLVVIGAGSDPASLTDSASVSTPTPSASSASLSASITPSSASQSSVSQTSESSLSSASSATESSLSASSASSASTTLSSTSSIPTETSSQLNLSNLPTLSASGESRAIITRTASVTAAQASESAAPVTAAAKKKSNVLTVLIAVAASIGGVAILWTVFRKWKLARSSKFDQRLQPIDWQPTNPDDSPSIHRRANSDTSFQSGSVHDNMAGRGVGGYGATAHGSDQGHGSSDYGHNNMTHDFTAGNTNLAPVGGYADLARGPSPQPHMQQTLGRGPSLNRPAYEVGVPLHHQTGYAEAYDYNGDRVRF